MARNGHATGVLARACADRGLDLAIVSTNEVFDGTRPAGEAYGPDDPTNPINPYGVSKLAGETAARAAYDGRPGSLGIVRTAWLFGSPASDFPGRILAAGTRAREAGQPLRVVADEWGTPTYTHDLAEGIVDLLAEDAVAGTHHIVNGGVASRADWARDVFARVGLTVETQDVSVRRVAATVHAAGPGHPRGDPDAVRRPAPDLAGGHGRLRPDAAARLEALGMSLDRPPSALPGRPLRGHRPSRGRARGVPRAVARERLRGDRRAGCPRVRPGQPVQLGVRRAARSALPSAPARLLDGRVGTRLRRPG